MINTSFALDPIVVKKNDTVPMDGLLFSDKDAKELRKQNEERKLLKQENIELKELGLIQDEKNKLLKNQWEETSKELTKSEINGTMKGVGGFLLGVLATSVAAFAAAKTIRK